MHAPPFQIPLRVDHGNQYGLHRDDPGSLAYTFEFGAAAFFVMDTRTMRIKNRQEQMMLGEGQWQALEDWLLAVKDAYPLKFLVTSCAVLFSMWADIPRDRWSGFPKERDRLLHFLAANGIEGVYFLTGDLHSAHAISADLYGPNRQPLRIWEFCSTPFECAAPTRQEKHFIVDRANYGVVRVDFPAPGKPQVRFDLYYEDKGEWKVKTA
ncbi:MAG: alkaline phosphatase D family protein, partial [Chloroflexota bacterium]